MKTIKCYLKDPYKLFLPLASKGYFDWMSDETYLKLMYRARTGRKLNLDNPQTFNEKMQWLKLYDRKPEYPRMVDKYEVKKFVADQIGEEYIIPTLGVWDSFDEIDFEKLPNQFVLKCTHDSGGLAICKDKDTFDMKAAQSKIENALKKNYYKWGREWPYKNVKPRIIAEKYMVDSQSKHTEADDTLTDYKFYCFNGTPFYLYVSDHLDDHSKAHISFADMEYKPAPFKRNDYKAFDKLPRKPENFEKMKQLASKLSNGYAFLRVDLYEIQHKIYFGELTFCPCSGVMPFEPEEWDKKLGDLMVLPQLADV